MEMSLGKRIRELRTMKNLSQEAVAEKCNVSTPAVSHWETDSSSPSRPQRLCNVLYLSTTPQAQWEVIRRSAANRVHRNLTSAGFSASPVGKYH